MVWISCVPRLNRIGSYEILEFFGVTVKQKFQNWKGDLRNRSICNETELSDLFANVDQVKTDDFLLMLPRWRYNKAY